MRSRNLRYRTWLWNAQGKHQVNIELKQRYHHHVSWRSSVAHSWLLRNLCQRRINEAHLSTTTVSPLKEFDLHCCHIYLSGTADLLVKHGHEIRVWTCIGIAILWIYFWRAHTSCMVASTISHFCIDLVNSTSIFAGLFFHPVHEHT